MTKRVLLLNTDATPRKIIGFEDAVDKVIRDVVIPMTDDYWRISHGTDEFFMLPKVLMHKHYQAPMPVTFTKDRVKKRDNFTCAYCGVANLHPSNYTYDHIVPKSRGGKDSWMNGVCACRSCNQKKNNRTPEEAGMPLLFEPHVPSYIPFSYNGFVEEAWEFFLQHLL